MGERNQKGADGGAYIHSNIDDQNDPEKCFEFYATAERNERKPSPDQVTIDMGRSPALMRRVANHPECEPAVIAAYRADPNGTATIELRRGADTLKRIIRECDDRPKPKSKEQKSRDSEDGITWRLGRGGRTQWRIVVSFPWYFTAAQRREALHLVCDHFAEMGCMYMGVIHEASASNDWRNDHAHVDIYDRPCRRLTGDEEHDLANVPERWIDEVRKEYREEAYKKDIGRWDFEVEREVRYKSGNRGTHRIFGANKSSAMRAYSVPMDSRQAVAAIINKIAVRDFGRESVHHQSYAELDIAKQPDEPLGPKDHALQGKGGVSDVGLRNELRHVEFRRQEIDTQYRHRHEELTSLSIDYIKRTSEHRQTGARFKEREAASTALLQEQALAEFARDAAILQLEVQRQLSSAYHVIRTSGRVIRKGDDKRGDYAMRREEARRYWRTWVKDHADIIRVLKDLKAHISSLENRPSLDGLIAAVFAPQMAGAKASTGELHSAEPGLAILPTKRMNALLQSSSTAPVAQQVNGDYVVPGSLQDPAVHAEPPALQKREAARPLLVVPPLSKLPEAVVAEALEEEAVAHLGAAVNVGHQQKAVALSTVESRSQSGKDERLGGSAVPHIDASLPPGHSASTPGVRPPRKNLDTLELAVKLAAGATPPIRNLEGPGTYLRAPDRAGVADGELTTPGVLPGLSRNPLGHAEARAMQAAEAVFRPLIVPPLVAPAEATLVNGLVEKLTSSQPKIAASIVPHADRPVLPEEQAFKAAQTEDSPGAGPLPQIGDTGLDEAVGGMQQLSGASSHSEPHTRAPARRLAQGPDPEANRAFEPRAETNNLSSGKERVVEKRLAEGLADAAHCGGGLAHEFSFDSTNSARQAAVLSRPAVDDLHRLGPKPEEPTAMAEGEGRQGPGLETSPEIMPSARASDPTVRASLAKQLMDAWDELNLNDMETRDEISRVKRSLVLRDGEVTFAKPEAASESHRRFLAAFPRAARRLFAEQQDRLKSEQEKEVRLQQGTGLA